MRLQSRHAFTLIELLVVIMMIALMASIIVPRYAGFYKHTQFRAQVRDVMNLFAYAREQAVSNDTTVTVTYDQQRGLFSAVVTPPAPIADQPAVFATSDASQDAQAPAPEPRTVQLPDRYQARSPQGTGSGQGSGSGSVFHFRGDGTVEGGQIEILDTEAGDQALLLVSAATGRITLEEDVPSP